MMSTKKQPWYSHQYKSQEATRALNKREQRKLDNVIGGRGSIATEYKFNLGRVNHEQKIIEKELEKIRQGAHRLPGNASQIPSSTKFHHPQFGDFNAPKQALKSPRPRAKEIGKPAREPNDSSLNTTMLIDYLANFNKAPEYVGEHIQNSGSLNPNKQSESLPVQIKPAITSDQMEAAGAENLTISIDRARSQHNSDITHINKSSNGLSHTSQSDGLSLTQNHNSPGTDTLSVNSEMKSTRIDNRRKSRDSGYVPSMQEPGSEKRRVSECGIQFADTDKVIPAAQGTSRIESSETRPQEQKRIPRAPAVEDLLKKPMTDPSLYNPDGSLKTMYQLPPFDKTWEEAKKARYIRTREPLERDRQLSAHEIFDKSG